MAISAISSDFRCCQTFLGEKSQAGPGTDIVEVLRQTVGTLFWCLETHQSEWLGRNGSEAVTTIGPDHAISAEPMELDRARTHLIGTHAISLQRNSARAAVYAFDECYGLGADASEKYAERIAAVRADDVLAAAQRVLAPSREVIALVAPEGAIPPELAQ